jgi:hypothetical protein
VRPRISRVRAVGPHPARSRAIVADLEYMFWGDRTYVAEDPEGHRWTFAEHTRDVDPAKMSPPGQS